jgi:hypothetical protein
MSEPFQFGTIGLAAYRFRGRAGELQDREATAALVAELGRNYALYHEQLEQDFGALGPRPEPQRYKTLEDFRAAWSKFEEIVRAEVILRNCRQYLETGRNLGAAVDLSVPLVNARDELVSLDR